MRACEEDCVLVWVLGDLDEDVLEFGGMVPFARSI